MLRIKVKDLEPGMIVVDEIGRSRTVIRVPQQTHHGYYYVHTTGDPINTHGEIQVRVMSYIQEVEQLAKELGIRPAVVERMMETADDLNYPQTFANRFTILPCNWWYMRPVVRERKIQKGIKVRR